MDNLSGGNASRPEPVVEPLPVLEALKLFAGQCTWVWIIHVYYKGLFQNREGQELMEKFAHRFFADVDSVFVDYLLLRMCGLADAAGSGGRENLTINNLFEKYEWPDGVRPILAKKVARINKIVKPMRAARNKIIAHLDKETARMNSALGAFPAGEDEELFRLLQETLDLMHDSLAGGPWPFKTAAGTDVGELIVNLRQAASALDADGEA